jgi:SPP1 gp7 family putative phage head morphogenesis protein
VTTSVEELVLRRAAQLRRYENDLEARVRRILDMHFTRIEQLLLRQDPTQVSAGWQRARLEALFRRANEILSDAFGDVNVAVRGDLKELGGIAAKRTALETAAIAKSVALDWQPMRIPSRRLLAAIATTDPVQGAPLRLWWAQQLGRAQLAVRREIQLGMIRREPIEAIVRRIRGRVIRTVGNQRVLAGGVLETSVREATTIVRTAVNEIYNRSARLALEENADFIWGMEWVCVLDERTCLACGNLDGMRWRLDDPSQVIPPLHPNDRCTLIAVFEEGAPRRRESYPAWFARQTPERQRRILGKSRFALYQQGEVTFSDLVSRDHRTLTLAELGVALQRG